ncbi:MAG: hypothetical protein GY699_03990 [Desulfobacteraceae bacterium]|nr:hypothetical protein [Desulfobacteraceae bacterium]
MMLLISFTALFFIGCSNEPTSLSFPKSEMPIIFFQGFNIPKFPTAQGQLNYAKSGFPSPEEKKAAFQFLFHHFPKDKIECGNAALYLAYMNFGFDYRFALIQDYNTAIKEYSDVIKNFKGYPQILVKAYWYLGWIYCELLLDKKAGLPFFWHIIHEYPDLKMGIPSPVPWVSLVYPITLKGDKPQKEKIKPQWASIALLEIIRHSSEQKEVFKAFDALWDNYQESVSTGLAIKLLLYDKSYAHKALPHVEDYLALNIANRYLKKEIKDAAKEYHP